MIKTRSMIWAGYVTHMGEKEKNEGKGVCRRCRQ
jgi:hypothetical protein